MAGLSGRVHAQALAALLAPVIVPAPAGHAFAIAEQGQDHRYSVTLIETERFNGSVEAATFSCPVVGACVGLAHIGILGRSYDYLLSAVASDGQISFIFRGRTPFTPALNHRQGYPVGVPLAPDGTGQRDMALAALRSAELQSGRTRGGWGLPNPPLTPLANVRITVRREDVAERNR